MLDVASARTATVRPGARGAGDPGRGQVCEAPSLRPARGLAAAQSRPPGGAAQVSPSSVRHRTRAEPLCAEVAVGDEEASLFTSYCPLLRPHGPTPGTGGPILGMCAARTGWPCVPEPRPSRCSRQVPREAENTDMTAPRRAACTAMYGGDRQSLRGPGHPPDADVRSATWLIGGRVAPGKFRSLERRGRWLCPETLTAFPPPHTGASYLTR